jgi:hypothetical protein
MPQQVSCNQTRRSTGPPRCYDAPFESGSLLRQESGLISWHNEAMVPFGGELLPT